MCTRAVFGAALLSILIPACGANVAFDDADESGGGGSTDTPECFIGSCGDDCTKCIDDECFPGYCSADRKCEPAGVVCPAD